MTQRRRKLFLILRGSENGQGSKKKVGFHPSFTPRTSSFLVRQWFSLCGISGPADLELPIVKNGPWFALPGIFSSVRSEQD